MAPVMSMLFAAQTDIMTLSVGDLKEALKRFDKAPDVSRMGMFTNHPDDIQCRRDEKKEGRKKKEKRKREGDGFRGEEERGY